MPYARISDGAACCWRFAEQRFHEASTAHGALVGRWGGAGKAGAVAAAPGSVEDNVTRPDGCMALCDTLPHCTSFSYSATAQRCALCSTCTLRNDSTFTSWAKVASGNSEETAFYALPAQRLPHTLLEPLLQDEYSVELYGSKGLVTVDSLRLVWLALLPPSALTALAQVGACRYEPRLPLQPFFTNIDRDSSNPIDAVWVEPRVPQPFASK